MNVMIGFMKAIMSMKKHWLAWIGLLVAANVAAPIYFIASLEAQVVLAAVIAGFVIQMAIFRAKGFVRLLGMGHILWVPMIPWLWTRLDQIALASPIGYWLVTVMVLNSVSLIIDVTDVLRYIRGERAPIIDVEG